MGNIAEAQAGSHSPRKLVEMGWAPLVTVLYIVVSLATAGSLDYALVAALVALSITCIVYARKPPLREEAPLRRSAEPQRVEPPKLRTELPPQPSAPPIEPPKARSEPPPPPPPSPEKLQPATEPPRAERQKSKSESSAGPAVMAAEAPASAAMQKQLDEARAELERARTSSAVLEKEIAEQARREAERLDVAMAITGLKERARTIRRQWPEAAFCQRPLRPQWWTPNATQSASTAWLAPAHDWHSHFQEARPRLFPDAAETYLQSLDIEEVIDFLDDRILSRESRPLHRDVQVSGRGAPVLVLKSWGAPEGEEEKCGFWIENTGDLPASNIQLARAAIGSKLLSIYLPPTSTLSKDQRLFVIATLTGPQRVTAYNLEDLMKKLPANSINGGKPLGVGLRLIYDSKDGSRYSSRHEMTLENGTIKVGYLNTELLGMPL